MNRQRSSSPLVLAIVIGIAALIVLINLAAPNWLWQGSLTRVLRPVESAATTIGRVFESVLRPFTGGSTSQEDVLKLQQQLTALSAENVRLREFQAQAQQLRPTFMLPAQ